MITTINKHDHKTSILSLQEELEKSAISPEIAALNFIEIPENFDPDNNDAAELLLYALGKEDRRNDGRLNDKYNRISNVVSSGGWWCGTLTPDGRPSPWGCFKPVAPRKNRDGKIIKYEHPPKTDTQPFFLKVDRSHWKMIAEGAGVQCPDFDSFPEESIPHEFWGWVQSRPQVPIVITEGAKKAASLLSAGFCAIGLPGIWAGIRNPMDPVMGQKSGAHHLIPELVAIAQPDRSFIFCFDQDEKPKTIEAVNRAIATTGGLLCQHTGRKSYSIMRWDVDGKGIDDVHAAFGSPYVHRIFGDREEKKVVVTRSKAKREAEEKAIAEALAEAQAYSDLDPSESEILEAHAKAKFESAMEIVKNNDPEAYAEILAKTSTPLQPVVTYIDAVDPDKSAAEEEEEPEKPPSLTFQEICYQQLYCKGKDRYIALNEKEIFKFNGKYYEQLSPVIEKRRIVKWAENYVVKEKGRRSYAHMKPSSINSIWEWVLSRLDENPKDINPPGFNFDNGILRIHWEGRTPHWKLHPHSPKEKYLVCSPVKFDPEASSEYCDRLLSALDPIPASVLMRNLSGVFDLDKIFEIHGRIFRAGFAVGSGANGKDTFRDIVSLLFPNRVVSVPLTKFVDYDNGKTIALKKLEHAWINWSTENNRETPVDKIECLNLLVSGEGRVFEVEEKYIASKTMDEAPKTVYIFNCNNPPILKSGLKSIRSRIVVYKFNKTFDPNPDLSKGELQADSRFKYDKKFQIEQIAPAFLNRLLAEFKNLALHGIDYRPLEEGLDELRERSTHLWSFVKDVGLVEDPNEKIWTSDLWEALESWYLENGTLEKRELYDGSIKRIWNDQPLRFDNNVTSSNQLFHRFQKLFPNITKQRETKDPARKGKYFISGLCMTSASLLHYPVTASTSASPTASPVFTNSFSPSLSISEGSGEGKSEAETLGSEHGEAVKQHSKTEKTGSIFVVGEIVRDKRTGERLQIVELPTIGSAFKDQSHLCRRECAWWVAADLKRKGSDAPLEVGCIAEHLQTEELVSILQFSEDGLWAWVERNDISVPAKFLAKEAGQ